MPDTIRYWWDFAGLVITLRRVYVGHLRTPIYLPTRIRRRRWGTGT